MQRHYPPGEYRPTDYQPVQNRADQYDRRSYDSNDHYGDNYSGNYFNHARAQARTSPWWRRKFFKLPAWLWIGMSVPVFIMAIVTNEADTKADEVATNVTVANQTASSEPAPPTAEASTPGASAETTFAPLSVEQVQQVFTFVFDNQRGDIISIVEDDPLIETVDVLDYDENTGVISLEVTPLFDIDDGVRDDAWNLTRAFGAFYMAGGPWVNTEPPWSPTLDIKVSSAHYTCSGDQLQQVADSRFSRDDWEAGCRVG